MHSLLGQSVECHVFHQLSSLSVIVAFLFFLVSIFISYVIFKILLSSPFTEPAPEGVLVVSEYDETSITILWANPNNPDVSQFIVRLLQLDGSTMPIQTIVAGNMPTPLYRVVNLIPGREYHISVAFSGTGVVLSTIQRTSKSKNKNNCE